MNKKFCVVIIALIMLCMASVVVFAQYSPTTCPAHRLNWHDGCRTCREAQRNIERNNEARREREREQRQREAEARRQREAEEQRQREAEAQRQREAENQQPSGGIIIWW